MRDRGYSLEDLKEAGREGRLAFGFTEELFAEDEGELTVAMIAAAHFMQHTYLAFNRPFTIRPPR